MTNKKTSITMEEACNALCKDETSVSEEEKLKEKLLEFLDIVATCPPDCVTMLPTIAQALQSELQK